jgi:hypothetical protein
MADDSKLSFRVTNFTKDELKLRQQIINRNNQLFLRHSSSASASTSSIGTLIKNSIIIETSDPLQV